MSEHTPGPWSIEPHGKGFVLYSGRDNQRHGMNLVYLTEPDWNWEANARLIAAAPRMLEALERVTELLLATRPEHMEILNAVNLALQKATGEA